MDELKDKINENEKDNGDTIICPSCNNILPNTLKTCPVCGAYLLKEKRIKYEYQPMTDAKIKKIKGILTVVLLVIFVLIYILLK